MIDEIIFWIKKQVKEAGAAGCVFGLSGGLDSSVVSVLCKHAFPNNVEGLMLPCFSRPEDLSDAQALAAQFSISTRLVNLRSVFNQMHLQLTGKPYIENYLEKDIDLALANIKPRLRMVALYYYANKANYLVVGTGNKSEAMMGYCTKHGDAGVDLLPLGGLLKSDVRELAKELEIPIEIINKKPSAGLWPGQTDEAEMGISYKDLDKIIIGIEKNNLRGLDAKLVDMVKQKMQQTKHKRCCPPIFTPTPTERPWT